VTILMLQLFKTRQVWYISIGYYFHYPFGI